MDRDVVGEARPSSVTLVRFRLGPGSESLLDGEDAVSSAESNGSIKAVCMRFVVMADGVSAVRCKKGEIIVASGTGRASYTED